MRRVFCILGCSHHSHVNFFFDTSVLKLILECYSNPGLSYSIVGFGIGTLILLFYFTTVWLQLFKSSNRCYAIIFPVHYHLNFTIKAAKLAILGAMALALLCIVTSFLNSCNHYFDTEIYIWTSREPFCLETVGTYTDLLIGVITLSGSLVCDVITFCYIQMANKNSHSHNVFNERKFFFQV